MHAAGQPSWAQTLLTAASGNVRFTFDPARLPLQSRTDWGIFVSERAAKMAPIASGSRRDLLPIEIKQF